MLLNCGIGEDSCKSLGLQMTKTVNPRGNQPSVFIGGTNAKAEATGDLPDPGIESRSPALQADSLPTEL